MAKSISLIASTITNMAGAEFCWYTAIGDESSS
jgi:hypothetical protein